MERDADVQAAIEVLKKGGIILYPTDTIWGIGCDATNEDAVRRVFELKRRTDSKALICLVDSPGRLQRYVRNVPEVAWDIIELATKPTTVILSGATGLAPNLLAEDGSVGLRVTSEVFSHQLCYRFQKAIVSTSANISGEPSPQTFADISDEIKAGVDYICTSRQRDTSHHEPSSIIKLEPDGQVCIIRK
ncbi:MAG: threonylcarbamoyl-AMP synthase [Bacteroidales bacterium]|nr:threonylcarbamoyl-AMP synthase [Bacteroidales bacterium]